MEPRISRQERKLHLSYDLPHRIHSAHIYPIAAPNGSTVIVYGHEQGLRVLWRGGRRRKQELAGQANNAQANTIDLISDDENNTKRQDKQRGELYEAEEEEQDPDCPYPNIIQDLDIVFGDTQKARGALRVAVPNLNPTTVPVRLLRSTAIVAVGCTDGKIVVLSIPLDLPVDEEKEQLLQDIAASTITLQDAGPIPADMAVKFLAADQSVPARQTDDAVGQLLVASVLRALQVWSLDVTGDAILATGAKSLRRSALPSPAKKVRFHPSSRQAQILVTDPTGAARIYDPFAVSSPRRRPGSSDSTLDVPSNPVGSGKWVMTYLTAFHTDENRVPISAAFARRKSILDARWALSGKAIIVLLEDGEWGLWDIASVPSGKRVEEFAIRGFLGTAGHTEAAEATTKRRGLSKLAPMTPNTRKVKEEQLFSGTPKLPGVATRGGISISAVSSRSGATDESAVLWYNSDIYCINSLQSFYQRSTSNSGGIGSLYSPGLTHVTDIKLFSEEISSISQFNTHVPIAGIGQMNTQRDILVSAEHRAVILQSLRPSTPSRQLFQAQVAGRPAVARDQRMLDAGMLDIDGMDRMLDNMAETQTAPSRRVGFATALG